MSSGDVSRAGGARMRELQVIGLLLKDAVDRRFFSSVMSAGMFVMLLMPPTENRIVPSTWLGFVFVTSWLSELLCKGTTKIYRVLPVDTVVMFRAQWLVLVCTAPVALVVLRQGIARDSRLYVNSDLYYGDIFG